MSRPWAAHSGVALPQFDISDEAVAALWDGLAFELDELAAASSAPHLLLEVSRRLFLDMLANFPEHVLTCVTVPAFGTGESTLGVGVSGTFKRHFASAAQNLSDIAHGSMPSLSRGRAARPN